MVALERDPVADLPAKTICGHLADDGALPVIEKGLPLFVGNLELGEEVAIGVGVYGELGKEVLGLLVDGAEPGSEGRFGNVIDLAQAFLIGEGERHDQRDLVADDQTIDPGDVDTGVECGLDGHQQAKEKEGDGDRADSEDVPRLFSK
jgi:hypothetical protein